MRRNVAKQVKKHGFFLPPTEPCVLNMEVAQLIVIEKIPAGSNKSKVIMDVFFVSQEIMHSEFPKAKWLRKSIIYIYYVS